MSARPRSRAGVAAASLVLHIALLAAFALKPEPPAMRAGAGDAGVIAVTLAAAPPGPPAPAAPEPEPASVPAAPSDLAAATEAAVAPLEVAAAPAAEPFETAGQAGDGADAGGCTLSDRVLAALQAEAPRAALARIPDRRRSVAGAVMLWDGGWVRTGALADSRIARPIRTAVAEAVRAAEPACAAAPIAGPVLLILPEAGGALVLVVGSGTWRWADLAADEVAPHPTATGGR